MTKLTRECYKDWPAHLQRAYTDGARRAAKEAGSDISLEDLLRLIDQHSRTHYIVTMHGLATSLDNASEKHRATELGYYEALFAIFDIIGDAP